MTLTFFEFSEACSGLISTVLSKMRVPSPPLLPTYASRRRWRVSAMPSLGSIADARFALTPFHFGASAPTDLWSTDAHQHTNMSVVDRKNHSLGKSGVPWRFRDKIGYNRRVINSNIATDCCKTETECNFRRGRYSHGCTQCQLPLAHRTHAPNSKKRKGRVPTKPTGGARQRDGEIHRLAGFNLY